MEKSCSLTQRVQWGFSTRDPLRGRTAGERVDIRVWAKVTVPARGARVLPAPLPCPGGSS